MKSTSTRHKTNQRPWNYHENKI